MKYLNGTTSQIDRILGKDDTRWNITNAFFHAQRGHLVATNGHTLAVVNVLTEEGDSTGWVTREALVAWRTAQKKVDKNYRQKSVSLLCMEKQLIVQEPDGQEQSFKRPPYSEGSYPDYRKVLPDPSSISKKPAFTLDIKLLADLVDALGYPGDYSNKSYMVAVFPSKTNTTAHLVKTTENGPLGIIMPMKAPDENAWLMSLEAVDQHFAALKVAAEERKEKREELEKEAATKARQRREEIQHEAEQQVENGPDDVGHVVVGDEAEGVVEPEEETQETENDTAEESQETPDEGTPAEEAAPDEVERIVAQPVSRKHKKHKRGRKVA